MEVDWTELNDAWAEQSDNAIGITHDHPEGFCPTCQRRIPKKQEKPEEKKIRKTFSIAVPVDEQENGAECLTVLLEEVRKELFTAGLPYGESDAAKYYVLSTALSLFVLHAKNLLSDG